MIKKLIVSSLIASISIYAAEFKLDDLVKEALAKSPDLKISKADYDASKEQVKQADAGYLPTLDLVAQTGVRERDYGGQVAGEKPNEFEPGSSDTNLLQAKVTAKQLLYDFGKTTGNIEEFENKSLSDQAAMQQDISDKIYAVKHAYFSYLYANAMITVNTENIKLNEQQLNRAKRYYGAGIRTKVDVTDAEVNLIEAQLSLQDTGYAVKLALVELKKEIGISENIDTNKYKIYIQEPVAVDVYESLPKLTLNVNTFQEEAFTNRAELEQYIQKVNSAQSSYKKVDGDYYPSLYGNANYMTQDVDKDAFAPEEEWEATVSLEWNLYSGNSTDAITQEARIMIMRAEADLENTRLSIQKEVNDAYIKVNKDLDNTKLSENLSILSKEKFVQVQKRYEAGLADYVELQQARQNYINSKGRLTQSYYAYYKSMALLDHSVGK